MKSILIPSIWAIGFLSWLLLSSDLVESQQTSITLEMLQMLQDRIDEAKTKIANVEGTVAQINNQVNALDTLHRSDMATINNKLGGIDIEIGGLKQQQAQLRTQVAALETQLQTLQAEMDARMTKLENTNQIWKANFRVVNKTFAELRRKFKIGIPMITFPNGAALVMG